MHHQTCKRASFMHIQHFPSITCALYSLPHKSSNLARVILLEKSTPSNNESISTVACVDAERVHFARSHAERKRRNARSEVVRSFLYLFLNSLA